MGYLVELNHEDIETITEMLREYRAAVLDGSISGFGQTKEEEAADAQELINKLAMAVQ